MSMTSYHHVLQIDGYSTTSDILGNQKFYAISSAPFHAGSCTWLIHFYPNGTGPGSTGFISLSLDRLADTVHKVVTAQATFSLINQDRNSVVSYSRSTGELAYSEAGFLEYGYGKFMKREYFEQSKFLKNDCLAIRVDIQIVKEEMLPTVVPPSDMHQHLHHLLSSGEGADVELRVGGETFAAHRLVLGARSSVFKAELFRATKEGTTTGVVVIEIEDMEPRVLRAMLTFIYTDTWPDMDHQDVFAMAQRLTVVADRYNLQRLKLMCEDRLCNHIDTRSVATILALAKKHQCRSLKKACFGFLGSFVALSAVIGTKEFESLELSCPAIMKELICNVVARHQEKRQIIVGSKQQNHVSVMFF